MSTAQTPQTSADQQTNHTWWGSLKARLLRLKIHLFPPSAPSKTRSQLQWDEVRDIKLSLDYEALTRELRPIERGRDLGAQQLPPSNATAYDQFHIDLVNAVMREMHAQASQRDAIIRDRTVELLSITPGTTEAELQNILTNFSAVQVPQIIEAADDELVEKYRVYESAEREYRLFRAVHKRLADARPRKAGWLFTGIILLLLLAETLINAQLLKDLAPPESPLPHFFGFLFGITNTGVAFLIGATLCKRLNYIDDFRNKRRLATFLLIVSLLLLVIVLLLMANARTYVTIHDVFSPDAASPVELFSFTYWLARPGSVLMFFLSLLFAGLGLALGYWTTGDTYPGYASSFHNKTSTRRAFYDCVDDLKQKIYAAREDTKNRLYQVASRLRADYARFIDLKGQYDHLAARHFNEHSHAREVAMTIAHSYRSANELHRGASEVPTYFHSESLPIPAPPGITQLDLEKHASFLATAVAKAETDVERYQSRMNDQLAIEMQKLEAAVQRAQGQAVEEVNRSAPPLNAEQRADHSY